MSVRVLSFALATSCVVSCAGPAAEVVASDPALADIQSGMVSGVMEDDVVAFKGIPFARPPVGDLRWRAPQPVEGWDGVYAADSYGHDCMQVPFAADAAPLRTEPSEDCLYLNIWKPAAARPGDDLPVIVWIYGGGWVNGGSSPAVYEGGPTAREGVVFLSFNYRLGRFGFFADPALTAADEDDGWLGNYGYMDQLAALEWVRGNIEAFGGDPGNVTIMGESAGGGAVVNLLTSSQAEGLFHRALAMSAPARLDSTLKPLRADGAADAEADGEGFAQWAAVTGSGADALAALRALPAETVVAGTGMFNTPVAPASGPMIDGTILRGADRVLAQGGQIKVPTMAGAVSEDIGFGPELSPEELFAQYPDPDAARAAYAEYAGDPDQLRRFMYADRFMQEPARFIVKTQAEAGVPAYHYRYGYVAEPMRDEWSGMPHANEIPFFLNTVEARYGEALTQADRHAAALINSYLVNFARTGDPNGPGLPDWSAFESDNPNVMNITFDSAEAGEDPWQARLDVNEALAEQGRAPGN